MKDLGAFSPFSMAFHQKGHDPKRLEKLGLQGAIPVSGEVSNLRLGKREKKSKTKMWGASLVSLPTGSNCCFFWNADFFFKSNR